MEKENFVNSKLILEDRKTFSITGVSTVDGFSSEYLRLTVNGSKLIINGKNIKITGYNKTTGNLTADGNFDAIKFDEKKQSIIGRIFK